MSTEPQPGMRENADVIPSSSSPEPRQGFLLRWRRTMTAAGILLLALGAVAGAAWFNYEPEYVRAARAEPVYTYEDLRRRTDGPDHILSGEKWEKLQADFKVRLAEVEAIQMEAMHTYRPSLQEVEDAQNSFLSAGQARSKIARALKEFDLFKMLDDDGKGSKNQLEKVEAEKLKEHHEKHKDDIDTPITPVDPDELDGNEKHGNQHKHDDDDDDDHDDDDDDDDEDDDDKDKDLGEDEEAKKKALDMLSEEQAKKKAGNADNDDDDDEDEPTTAEEMKERFEKLQAAAREKAKTAQEAFEKLKEAREQKIEKKRKAEQQALEDELAQKKLKTRRKILERRKERAIADEKLTLKRVSLYCMALMMPGGYEPGLLLAQKHKSVGIFQCDEWAVYSNQSTMLDGSKFPFPVHRVKGPQGQNVSLFVPLGGKWHTALNRDVFNQVWLEVLKVGRYRFHDWIVKVDPDSVYFPNRLKEVMGRRHPMNQIHDYADEPEQLDCRYCKKKGFETQTCSEHVHWMQSQGGSTCRKATELVKRPAPTDCGCSCNDFACDVPNNQAMYLNNCRFGLHGPIEIYSRRALAMYIAGLPMCASLLYHAWGEDKFTDQCMIKLGLTRVDVFDIMSEIACGEQPAPCGQFDTTFHPFKNVEKWFACWNFANKYGHGPEDRLAAIEVEEEDILAKLKDKKDD